MDITARLAADGDRERLEELRLTAREEVRAERGGALLVRSGAAGMRSGETLSAVVEIDGFVVGHLDASLGPLPDGGLVCRVGEIYVDAAAREVGAGEALMELATRWAADRGAEGMDVVALPGTRETKNFFEQHGFAARLIVMHKSLESGIRLSTLGPLLAVGAIVRDDAGRFLVVERGRPPAAGYWSVPGGKVEAGEDAPTALRREVLEETGLEVEPGQLVGWVEQNREGQHYAILDFGARLVPGTTTDPRPGDDAASARWVTPEELRGLRLVDGLADFLAAHGLF